MKESNNSGKNSKRVLVLSITPSFFADIAKKGHVVMDLPEGTNRLAFVYARDSAEILQIMKNEKFIEHLHDVDSVEIYNGGEIPKGQVN